MGAKPMTFYYLSNYNHYAFQNLLQKCSLKYALINKQNKQLFI